MTNTTPEALRTLFESRFQEPSVDMVALKRHASARRLFRIKSPSRTVIGVVHEDSRENRAFIDFTSHFRRYSLPVPDIYVVNPNETMYLEEDLGDDTLFEVLKLRATAADRFPHSVEALYAQAVSTLPRFQIQARQSLDFSICCAAPIYDRNAMLSDLHYFRDSFLSRFGLPYAEDRLAADFERLVEHLLGADNTYFIYRDFQSRNIMVRGESLYFIDYQGGRRGPLQYDLVSLLYQTRADIPQEARDRLTERYLDAASDFGPLNRQQFIDYVPGFVVIRLLQTLGTYGKVGLGQNHPDFVSVIPRALETLKQQLSQGLAVPLVEVPRVVEALQGKVAVGV